MLTGYICGTMFITLRICLVVHGFVVQVVALVTNVTSVSPHTDMSQSTSGPATHWRYQNYPCKYLIYCLMCVHACADERILRLLCVFNFFLFISNEMTFLIRLKRKLSWGRIQNKRLQQILAVGKFSLSALQREQANSRNFCL